MCSEHTSDAITVANGGAVGMVPGAVSKTRRAVEDVLFASRAGWAAYVRPIANGVGAGGSTDAQDTAACAVLRPRGAVRPCGDTAQALSQHAEGNTPTCNGTKERVGPRGGNGVSRQHGGRPQSSTSDRLSRTEHCWRLHAPHLATGTAALWLCPSTKLEHDQLSRLPGSMTFRHAILS